MKPLQRPLAWLAAIASVILVGCASPAQPKAMIGQKITEARATHDPVVVTVTGGEKTNPMWTSQISSEDFLTALIVSLRKSALFKSVEASGDAAYRLDATLEDLDQPIAGFNMTVALRVDWKLTRLSDNHVLWHDKILSTYTAKVGDAFAGIKRLRLANEGAARNNIEDALAKLAALDSAKLQQQQASLPE